MVPHLSGAHWVVILTAATACLQHGTASPLNPSQTTREAEPQWEQQAAAKNQRTNAQIPSQWLLSASTLQEAKKQQRLIGPDNTGMTIEDFIQTLPPASFKNPYVSGVESSANKTIAITNTDPVDLVAAMKVKKYTAVDVVTAFCLRTSVIHQILPVLLDAAFEEAVQAAQALDQHLNKTGELVGGLHGLPVTFKDVFHAANLETSGGFVGWFEPPSTPSPPQTQADYRYLTIHATNFQDNPKTFDSEVTQLLKAQGAIPIAKTTLMQTTWNLDTQNNYLGFLLNPYQLQLSAGGSSGGEGVLQALGGAAFGIGEDSGGSVSMPASLHGLYSLKPSSGFYLSTEANGTEELLQISGRMTMKSAVNYGTRLQCSEITATGIMSRSIRAVQYIYQSVVPPTKTPSTSTPKFVYLDNDGAITPHPPIQSAMRMVKAALQTATGATTQMYTGSSASTVSSIHYNLTILDGIIDNVHYKNTTGEPWASTLELPANYNPGPWNSADQQTLNYDDKLKNQYRSEYENLFSGQGIDALVMPTFASTDWPEGAGDGVVIYTSYANVLNVPSVTMFVTYASAKLDPKPTNFTGFGPADVSHMDLYNPQAVNGTPISVMLLGRLNQEDELLQAAAYLAEALSKN